ncbi:MAG: DUF2835 family protein [Succinivibrionaceae bacterium]
MARNVYEFSLDLGSDQVQDVMYRSLNRRVSVVSTTGLRIELPLSHFQKFVGYNGIHGVFRLTLDGSSFVSLEKISS